MKKSAALAAALVLCASQAWAYDNLQAGYSVQDKEPFYKMASSKLYAYSSFGSASLDKLEKMNQASVYLINYYTAEEMESILGEKFSTDYFAKQYEQMALLQRSQLDVRTVPSPLVDIERYTAYENKNNVAFLEQRLFKDQLKKLKPAFSVTKVNGRKTINISYLYRQGEALVAVDTSLVSAHDRLYMLSTVTIDEPAESAKQTDAEAADKETLASGAENGETAEAGMSSDNIGDKFSEALAKSMQIENVNPADVDKNMLKQFAKAHNMLLKGFKTLTPAATAAPVSFTDTVAQKTITLPQDWFYGQVQFKEKEAAGTFTMAASLPTMQKIANELDYQGMFALLAANDAASDEKSVLKEDDKTAFSRQQLEAKAQEEARKALDKFDALLLTCSFKINNKDFQEMLAMPRTNRLETELFLQQSLEGLQRYNSDYFALKDYSYNLDLRQDTAVVDIYSKTSLLQDFDFTNFLRLASLSDNVGSMLFYTHKSDIAPDAQIAKDIEKWQF